MATLEPDRLQIEAQLREFISKNLLYGKSEELAYDDSFIERGILDSTGVLELTTFVEEAFNIEIADDELIPENMDSIGDLIKFIQSKLADA